MFYHARWPIFFEDNHLLVLYKPAGLMMQRDFKNKANLLDMARQWIKVRYGKPGNVFIGMVHRLDGPVAGLVVLARTSKAASRLSAQFRAKTVTKQYLAVVEGRPPEQEQRVANYLVRQGRLSRIVPDMSRNSQEAVLTYRLAERLEKKALLQITLESGRRHQIRAQLAHLGCPIAGDINYGAVQAMPYGRIALLAYRLAFDHPIRRERQEFETPLPQGWPWPQPKEQKDSPWWSIEAFEADGLILPAPGR